MLLQPCILGNRGGLKMTNSSQKPLLVYFLIDTYLYAVNNHIGVTNTLDQVETCKSIGYFQF